MSNESKRSKMGKNPNYNNCACFHKPQKLWAQWVSELGFNIPPKYKSYMKMRPQFNPIALRKAKIAYNFGLSECNRVKSHQNDKGGDWIYNPWMVVQQVIHYTTTAPSCGYRCKSEWLFLIDICSFSHQPEASNPMKRPAMDLQLNRYFM